MPGARPTFPDPTKPRQTRGQSALRLSSAIVQARATTKPAAAGGQI